MTRSQAAKLRGLIQWYVECSMVFATATPAEVRAGALDEELTAARKKLMDFIKGLTT